MDGRFTKFVRSQNAFTSANNNFDGTVPASVYGAASIHYHVIYFLWYENYDLQLHADNAGWNWISDKRWYYYHDSIHSCSLLTVIASP